MSAAGADQEITINNLMTVSRGRQIPAVKVGVNDIGILTDIPALSCSGFIGEACGGKNMGAPDGADAVRKCWRRRRLGTDTGFWMR